MSMASMAISSICTGRPDAPDVAPAGGKRETGHGIMNAMRQPDVAAGDDG
jgi:hypothetical protein